MYSSSVDQIPQTFIGISKYCLMDPYRPILTANHLLIVLEYHLCNKQTHTCVKTLSQNKDC